MQTLKQPIRRCLISACFDIGTNRSAFDIPVVTMYHNLKKDTLETRVKQGFINLQLYKIDVPIKKIGKLQNKQKIYAFLKYALETVLPYYSAEKLITDIYLSPYFDALMMDKFNIINISNDPEPKKY